jgi:hypothetical protein
MKHVKLFEDFVNEAIADGSIESLIDVMKTSLNFGIFDDSMISDIKDDFLAGIRGSMKGEVSKLPTNKKQEFEMYSSQLMKPLEKAKTLGQFLSAMISVASAKENIMKRLSIKESINESKISDFFKNIHRKSKEWWEDNKHRIFLTLIELLAQIIVEILFAILRAFLKSDDLKAPKIKFGGGSFGGGGASGNW